MVRGDEQELKPSDRQYVGDLLREARSKAGVNLEEAAQALNMSPRHVRALEAGNFSVFAAEVYARGACERYARYLGVESDMLQRAWQRALREERQLTPLKVYTPASLLDRFLTPRLVLSSGGIFLAMIVGGYVIWQVRSFWQLPQLVLEEPREGVVQNQSIQLRGVAEEHARVRVNGESVLLGTDHVFAVEIWLHPGVNVLEVEAENAAGRIARVEKHVVRKD